MGICSQLNRVCICGKVKGSPTLRMRDGGKRALIDFQIEHSKRRGDGTVYNEYPCVAYGKTAEMIADAVLPGATLIVEGSLSSRRRTDPKSGKSHTVIEVEVSDVSPVSVSGAA